MDIHEQLRAHIEWSRRAKECAAARIELRELGKRTEARACERAALAYMDACRQLERLHAKPGAGSNIIRFRGRSNI